MNRKQVKNSAFAKHQLQSMLERGDIARLLLALFFIVCIKTFLSLIKVLLGLVRGTVNLAIDTVRTTVFAVQLAVARNRALRAADARTRWFGRATIMRMADILVFARCWPLRPNTFVARRVLKAAGAAAIIGLQSGDMTPEEARIWLAQIKRETTPRPAQSTETAAHPMYVRMRTNRQSSSDISPTVSNAGSQPSSPEVSPVEEIPFEEMNPGDESDEILRFLDKEQGFNHPNRMMK